MYTVQRCLYLTRTYIRSGEVTYAGEEEEDRLRTGLRELPAPILHTLLRLRDKGKGV